MRSTGSLSKGGLFKAKTFGVNRIFTRLAFGLKLKICRQVIIVKVKESIAIRSAVVTFADSTIGQASDDVSI